MDEDEPGLPCAGPDDVRTLPQRQQFPDPVPLRELLRHLRYRDDWHFSLVDHLDRGQGSFGMTLVIHIRTPDSYDPEHHVGVNHYFPVPPAAYDHRSWRRWLFDRIGDVETHERCEFFRLVSEGDFVMRDGTRNSEYVERPYAPSHGPGNDPYVVREVGTVEDQRTTFRGARF